MKSSKILFVFIFLVSGTYSFAEELNKDVKQYVICRNQKSVRTIRVECPQNKECNTIYNKEGSDRIEGSNNNILGGQKILGNIQRNLEKASWKCNDVTANARIDD